MGQVSTERPGDEAAREPAAELVGPASTRLLRTVDGLPDEGWEAPSLLPGWTRAHVAAHLALNAEALTRVLHGVVADPDDDVPRTMYDSDEQRDQDIEDLAAAGPGEIRERLLAATTVFADAVTAMPADAWETRVERTPGGRTMRTSSVPGMRLRELEIHHVDLDAGYATSDWTPAFAEHLLDAMAKRVSPTPAVEVRPDDLPRSWVLGSTEAEYPVPVVTGPAADLGWWLTGRPASSTLSCSHGELPEIEGW
jgi:maleylpyruvate isomerase